MQYIISNRQGMVACYMYNTIHCPIHYAVQCLSHTQHLCTFSYLMHFSVRKYFVSLFYRNETDSDDLLPLHVTPCANSTLCTLDEFIK